VHRPFLAAPIGRAAQDDALISIGMTGKLDLDAVLDRAPAL